jgi:photosystem II stability/assembly factor-like uncharacterized protein
MRKIIVLILVLPFLAASCTDIFSFGGGNRGIFKSEDNGQTFEAKVAVAPKGDIANLSINAIELNPSDPDILYVGSGNGIHKSEDGGETYRHILTGIAVAAIAVDPSAPGTVYAGGIAGKNGKILKSVDAGTNWIDIYNEPSQNNTVLAIAISKIDSSIVLAGLNNGELIRSDDNGVTWQATKDFANRLFLIEFDNNGNAFALTSTRGLFRSSDFGINWDTATAAITEDSFYAPSNSISAASNFFDLAIDQRQSGVMYLGTEQGIFRTINGGQNWSFLPLPVRNAALRVTAITVSPSNSNHLFASIASTIYKSTNGGLTWETEVLPTSASVRMIVINPQTTNVIYLGLRSQ